MSEKDAENCNDETRKQGRSLKQKLKTKRILIARIRKTWAKFIIYLMKMVMFMNSQVILKAKGRRKDVWHLFGHIWGTE